MNQEIEREIDIKDAFFYLLYHWRSFLIAGLLGLLLLAGFKYLSFDATPISEVSEEQEAYEREVKVYELNKENYDAQAELYQKQLMDLQAYFEDSVLMQIDPMQEHYASAELYIEVPVEEMEKIPESADMDITDQLLGAYDNFIAKGIDLTDIADKHNVKESYLKELISVDANYTANMINVEVIAPDKELALEIYNEVIIQAKEQATQITEDIRVHKIAVINEITGVRADSGLMDQIKGVNNQINSLQSSLTGVMTNIENLEEPEELEQTAVATHVSKKDLVKYGLIGLILGVFVLVAIYACIYLFSGLLATESELKDVFGCFPLGTFAPKYKKQGFLDKWLYKLAGVERRSDDVIANRIAQNITSLAKEGQTILLTGTVSDEMLADTLSILKDKVSNVNLTVSGCFTEDASAIGMIMQADSVIVVESRRVSKFAQVQKLLETIVNMDKPLMGYIMY